MIVKPKFKRILTPEGRLARKVEYESVSSLNRATQCMAEYWEHYKRMWVEPASARLVFGRALHDTCENVMAEKMHHGHVLPKFRVMEIFEMLWTLEMRDASERGLVWSDPLSPEQLIQKGKGLLEVWIRDYAPLMQPREVEMPFWIILEGCKRALYGRLDITLDDRGGGFIDYKSARHPWVPGLNETQQYIKSQAQVIFQTRVYHAGWFSVYKTWPAWAELHRFLTAGDPIIEKVDVLASEGDVQETFDTIVKPTIRKIEDAWETNKWPCTCGRHAGDRSDSPAAGKGPILAYLGTGSPAEDPHAGNPPTQPAA